MFINLILGPAAQRMIDERIKADAYASAEEVVTAALAALDREESAGDFEPGEMERLIEEGERSGDPLDGDEVFAELHALRARQVGKVG